MDFEWDPLKDRMNFRKHGIWFDEAKTVWADPQALEFYDDEHSSKEERYLRIGHSLKGRIVLVVFCERFGSTIVRLISARKATAKERKVYEERI